MIRAIIFDLDNCLSAADEPGRQLLEPVFHAIRGATGDHLSEDALGRAFADCWRHPLDWVAERHGFSPRMRAAGWEAYARLEVTGPMRGYPDLNALHDLPGLRFLVTSGFRRLQESKIRALAFERLFSQIHVDAIDEPGRAGKRRIFARILREHSLDPGEALVVGDNPDSEIEAGNRLGIATVQILRPGVPRGANASHYVQRLDQLASLVAAGRTGDGGGPAPG